MIGVNFFSIFLLVITLTDIINSVHGRSVDQAVLVYVVPEEFGVMERDEGKITFEYKNCKKKKMWQELMYFGF